MKELIQDSPEWHEWRKSGIGASEIAAIMGICPYQTPYGVWLVKTGRSRGFEGNSFTEHGKELEAKARARYELLNFEDMPAACATHPKYNMCIASLDGLRAGGRLILEIKCPKGRQTIDAAAAGTVPEHYWAQVQYQLAVTGADLLHFFVYHEDSGQDALVEVKPDLAFQGRLVAAAAAFWEKNVLANIPPPLSDKDVKVVEENEDLWSVCNAILEKQDKITKKELDLLKHAAVQIAQHPKVRCGRVQVSTVNRAGKFSYYKLTIQGEEGA